jgi:hypothetical protein
VLSRGGRPLLIRTLPGGYAGGLEGVARETRQTLLYHRDRLGGGELAGATLRPSDDDTREVAGRLREALGCEPEALRPWASIGASLPPGRGGGLAGAAACLLARDAA